MNSPSRAAERLSPNAAGRSIALVGMMGAGKSSIGRRLAQRLDLAFADSDAEIEKAARLTIPEIFAAYGEPHFRDGERRVIARLLAGGPIVLATGGGAFMDGDTRALIAERGLSVWIDADLDLLWRRVSRKTNRPLLAGDDPRGVLSSLLERRRPVYALADIRVASGEGPIEETVRAILDALAEWPGRPADAPPT
ncbi:MAG: shikimate kinase [Alphaproteobacteria bacterium]|nr:shikimate kinase [Alphaproteobacteria bacterium]